MDLNLQPWGSWALTTRPKMHLDVLETLLSDCSDVFLYKPFFPGEERTHFTCSSPHSAPRVRVRCGEGKIGGGIVGFCWNVVSQTWQKWVQCDVGLANLVYTRLRALWRSGGAIRREREACRTDGSFRGGGIVLVWEEWPYVCVVYVCLFHWKEWA